jgi:hypothetical protein
MQAISVCAAALQTPTLISILLGLLGLTFGSAGHQGNAAIECVGAGTCWTIWLRLQHVTGLADLLLWLEDEAARVPLAQLWHGLWTL